MTEPFYDSMRLELTGKCNVHCKYCFAADKNTQTFQHNEMSFDEISQVIREARALGVKDVALIGGEPLLNPDFWKIVDQLEGMRVAITTNAKLINEAFIVQLQNHPQVKEMRISLDGFESHDRIRRGSKHSQVIEAIALVRAVPSVFLTVQTTLHQQNLHELLPLYEFLTKAGIQKWHINPLHYDGERFSENQQELDFQSFDQLTTCIGAIIERYVSESPTFTLFIDMFYHSDIAATGYHSIELTDHPCEYRLRMICVQADGDIIFCPVMRDYFESGNIKTAASLREAIETEGRLSWEYLELQETDCRACKYVKICTTGCRQRALTLMGDILAPDPFSCAIVPRVYQKIVPLLPKEQQRVFYSFLNEQGSEPLLSGDTSAQMIASRRYTPRKGATLIPLHERS